MADVIGILGFTLHAAHKVYDVVKTCKEAPDTVQALGREASRVEGLLMMLQPSNGEIPSAFQDSGNPLVNTLVKDAEMLIAGVESFFVKTTKLSADSTREVRRVRWQFYAGRAKELSEKFRAFYDSLSAVYTVSTLYVYSGRSTCIPADSTDVVCSLLTYINSRRSTGDMPRLLHERLLTRDTTSVVSLWTDNARRSYAFHPSHFRKQTCLWSPCQGFWHLPPRVPERPTTREQIRASTR